MNDQKNGSFRIDTALLERTAVCDLSDDFTLPDYLPPVRRVISAECVPAPPSHYIGGGSAEFAGSVKYRLLYEGAAEADGGEGSGGLWCAEFPAEYDTSVPYDPSKQKEGEGLSVSACAETESVSARVTAPRRVTMRSRLRVRGVIYGQREYECMMHGAADDGDDDVRTLGGTARTSVTVCGMTEPAEYHDTVSRDELPGGEVRVICCRGEVFVSDAALTDAGVLCRGHIALYLTLCREAEGERPFALNRRIPVSAEIPLDGELPDGVSPVGVRAWGTCVTCTASVEEEGVVCEASAVWNAEAVGVRSFSYVRDMYSRTYTCECAGRNVDVRVPLFCGTGSVSVGGSDPGDEGKGGDGIRTDAGMKVLSCRGTVLPDVTAAVPEPEKGRAAKNCAAVSGRVRCCVLLDNGAQILPREFDVPFRFVVDIPETSGGEIASEIKIYASGCRARMEGDRPAVDCELCYAVCLWEKGSAFAVSEVRLGSPRRDADGGRRRARITVCYPAPGDTLWDIAKRYGADIPVIAADNNLDLSYAPDAPASISGSDFLII